MARSQHSLLSTLNKADVGKAFSFEGYAVLTRRLSSQEAFHKASEDVGCVAIRTQLHPV